MTLSRTGLQILALAAMAVMLAGCDSPRDPGYQGWVEADMIFVSPDESGRVTKLSVREGEFVLLVERVYSEHLLGWISETAADI